MPLFSNAEICIHSAADAKASASADAAANDVIPLVAAAPAPAPPAAPSAALSPAASRASIIARILPALSAPPAWVASRNEAASLGGGARPRSPPRQPHQDTSCVY